ncbi:MAG: hypothetical protein ACOC1O_04210 [bacterium]
MYYIFTDEAVTMVIEAEEIIDDYGQIEIYNMTRRLLYNSESDRLLYRKEKEEWGVIEKASEKNSKLDIESTWNEAVENWVVALELIHNLTKHDIIKRAINGN